MTISDETLREIAEQLDLGVRCYLNKSTNDVIVIMPEEAWDTMEDEWVEEEKRTLKTIEKNPDDYLEFEPMRDREKFLIMLNFIDTVDNPSLQKRLEKAVHGRKPFRQFSNVVTDAGGDYRQQWFDFKNSAYIDYVRFYH